MPEGPVYENNCDWCKYLAHVEDSDLYFCGANNEIMVVRSSGTSRFKPSDTAPLVRIGSRDPALRLARIGYLLAVDIGHVPSCTKDLYIPAVERLYDLSVQLANHYRDRRVALRVREVIGMMTDLSASVLENRKLVPECMDN